MAGFGSRTPLTLEQARAKRYNVWAGNSNGLPYRPGYCAEEVTKNERGALPYQCARKVREGQVYCGQHKKYYDFDQNADGS